MYIEIKLETGIKNGIKIQNRKFKLRNSKYEIQSMKFKIRKPIYILDKRSNKINHLRLKLIPEFPPGY